MKIDFAPLEPWLVPNARWDKSDARLHSRAKQCGQITEEAADRLMLRYAHIQVELVHPDLP